jgi:hypothetical protein
MRKEVLIKIINEEIGEFDFLTNEIYLEEQEEVNILQDEEFQKQFIIDSITNFKEKIKIVETESAYLQEPDYDKEEDGYGSDEVSLEYFIEIEYQHENKPIRFKLDFYSEGLTISWGSSYDPGRWGGTMADAIESSSETWYTGVDWFDIDPKLYTYNSDEIEFKAFENAGSKTQELFIRAYTEDIIKNHLEGSDWRVDKKPPYTSFNLQ